MLKTAWDNLGRWWWEWLLNYRESTGDTLMRDIAQAFPARTLSYRFSGTVTTNAWLKGWLELKTRMRQ